MFILRQAVVERTITHPTVLTPIRHQPMDTYRHLITVRIHIRRHREVTLIQHHLEAIPTLHLLTQRRHIHIRRQNLMAHHHTEHLHMNIRLLHIPHRLADVAVLRE